jgi:hypothetical protein
MIALRLVCRCGGGGGGKGGEGGGEGGQEANTMGARLTALVTQRAKWQARDGLWRKIRETELAAVSAAAEAVKGRRHVCGVYGYVCPGTCACVSVYVRAYVPTYPIPKNNRS